VIITAGGAYPATTKTLRQTASAETSIVVPLDPLRQIIERQIKEKRKEALSTAFSALSLRLKAMALFQNARSDGHCDEPFRHCIREKAFRLFSKFIRLGPPRK
jgi:uncharacterized BrkB/YihY/UPF0761 family membrane protein